MCLTRSLALMRRHSLPPLKNLFLRLKNKIRAIPSIMTRITKGERHIRLHCSTSRIQIAQNIHGACLTALTPIKRKQVMNVHMKNEEQTDSSHDTEIHPYQRPAKRLEHLQELSHGWQHGLSSSPNVLPSFFSMSSVKTGG
jgi:hypothetical protein